MKTAEEIQSNINLLMAYHDEATTELLNASDPIDVQRAYHTRRMWANMISALRWVLEDR